MSVSSMTGTTIAMPTHDAAVTTANPVGANPGVQNVAPNGANAQELAQARPRNEVVDVASRLHAMLDSARPTGKLQGMGDAFKQIKENVARPPFWRAGHRFYKQVLSAAKACDKASATLNAVPLEAFKESPMGEKAFAALKGFTDAQNNLYAIIQEFQGKTGSEAVMLENMKAASQFRASEAMNFVATMQMMHLKETQQQGQPHVTSTTFGGGMQELSHSMHGTHSVVNELVDTATDLFAQIDNLDSTKGTMGKDAFSEKIASISGDITALMNRVTTIMTEGGIEIPKRTAPVAPTASQQAAPTVKNKEGASAKVYSAPKLNVDNQAFGSLHAVLTGAQERLDKLAKADPSQGIYTAIRAIAPTIPENFIQLLPVIDLGSWCESLEQYNREAKSLVHAASQKGFTEAEMKTRVESLSKLLVPSSSGRGSFQSHLKTQRNYYKDSYNQDPERGGLQLQLAMKIWDKMMATPLSCSRARMDGIIADMSAMMTNASNKPQTREAYIKAAFEHDLDMGFVLEASLRSIPLEHLNLHASDTLLSSHKTLGQGAANTVTLCHYIEANGNTRDFVFKPEYAGRSGFGHLRVAGLGYGAQTQLMNLNLAANAVAQSIGCGDVIAQSSIGFHGGKIGLFMEHAKGVTAGALQDGNMCGTATNGKEYDFTQIVQLAKQKGQESVLQGNIAQALCKLEWADALSGQVDRHHNNYLVNVNPETFAVKVTGIDNDASFSVAKVGMQKFALNKARVSKNSWKRLKTLSTANETTSFTRDFTVLTTRPQDVGSLRVELGLNQFAKPKQIDRDTFTRLMALKVEPYKASLRQYMSDDAVEAAGLRLEDSQKHALDLEANKKIVDDWTNDGVLREAEAVQTDTPSLLKNFFTRDFGCFFPPRL